MMVICLNGPINSGKSTVGKALAEMLPDAVFADGDDHDAPPGASLAQRMARAFDRLETLIRACRTAFLILAYPLREGDHARLNRIVGERGAKLFTATLAPPLDTALSDRGTRQLMDWEKARIREMYAEGYATRPFSDVILDRCESPDLMAQQIASLALQRMAP